MENKNSLMMNTSILHRCTQKYYDKQLEEYQIGYGQLMFLLFIYENEGINMNELALKGRFDKGTVSKGIQKLELEGYIEIVASDQDKRFKNLYTTDKAKDIIPQIYMVRREWWDYVTKELSDEQIETFVDLSQMLSDRAFSYAQALENENEKLKIFGMQKLSLLDYPGKVACTLFTGGCNFRCPYCQNADLVFLPENMSEIGNEELVNFLGKRKGVLEGVCVSGGEPLLHEELIPFLKELKQMGYAVKLDTNGSFPDKLKEIVEMGLVDKVAMDIKNSKQRYPETVGINNLNTQAIENSVKYLMEGHVPYEFRTTIVAEFHDLQAMKEIGEWLKGADAYYLQNFEDSENVIQKGLHACSEEELEAFRECLRGYIPNTQLRGI